MKEDKTLEGDGSFTRYLRMYLLLDSGVDGLSSSGMILQSFYRRVKPQSS